MIQGFDAKFKNLNLKEIKALMGEKPAIVDGRRIYNPKQFSQKLKYIAIGLGKAQ